jgi:hypothetical protein
LGFRTRDTISAVASSHSSAAAISSIVSNSYLADVSAVTSTTVTTGTILEYAKLPPVVAGEERHRFLVASHFRGVLVDAHVCGGGTALAPKSPRG